MWFRASVSRDLADEDGATAVEYALMVSLIAAVVVGAVTTLGVVVNGLFGSVPAGV